MKAKFAFLVPAVVATWLLAAAGTPRREGPPLRNPSAPGEGSLFAIDPYSKNTGAACPLQRTEVKAEISGFLSRVRVRQVFQNNQAQKIEAIYVFPLPPDSAVDDMTLRTGDRTIRAKIKKRDEARRIYDDARNRGHVAALLDQERPNIFTQRVANIEPGASVTVEISYVETLRYEDGAYEFTFPMTVGPRYNPASVAPGEAARITPKYAPPETRAGHNLSLEVQLDAGVPVQSFESKSHEVVSERRSPRSAVVRLKQAEVIPNKDFVLRYNVAGEGVQTGLLTHRDARGGFFTLILQPPKRVAAEDVTPKELIFVLDTSGSMSGFPIEKAKETMRLALAGLYPRDTFNLITFSGDTHVLFPAPVPATPANLRTAQQFLEQRQGSGGTEMMKAVRAAFAPTGERGMVRVICFMTDGYVGNEDEILAEVRQHPEARVFSFGIGSSVNRYLLDGMARQGRGEVEYVSLNDDGSAAARRFHERVRSPLLLDVAVDFQGVAVTDVYPKRIPDLFSSKPVILHGRYSGAGGAEIRLRGRMGTAPYAQSIRVTFPDNAPAHDALATLWARTRVADLSARTTPDEAEITKLGLDYRLMTAYTSFVAVDETRKTEGGAPVVVEVPVEMPDGVSHEGVFGPNSRAEAKLMRFAHPNGPMASGGALYNAQVSVAEMVAARPKTERDESLSKLDSALRTMKSGRIRIEVWLTDATPAILAKLAKLGFQPEGTPVIAKIRTGWIDASKLDELSKLQEVLSVQHKPR